MRRFGYVLLVGAGGGTTEFGFFTNPNGAVLTSTDWGTLPELFEVVALAESGRLKANVVEHKLDDAQEVYSSIATGEFSGRAVIVPS